MNVKQLIEALEAVYVSMPPAGVFINGHGTDLDEEEL